MTAAADTDEQTPGGETQKPRPAPIPPRTSAPGQDPLVNPGYQPVPRDLPPTAEPARPAVTPPAKK